MVLEVEGYDRRGLACEDDCKTGRDDGTNDDEEEEAGGCDDCGANCI